MDSTILHLFQLIISRLCALAVAGRTFGGGFPAVGAVGSAASCDGESPHLDRF